MLPIDPHSIPRDMVIAPGHRAAEYDIHPVLVRDTVHGPLHPLEGYQRLGIHQPVDYNLVLFEIPGILIEVALGILAALTGLVVVYVGIAQEVVVERADGLLGARRVVD